MVASMIDLLPVEAYTQLEASVSVQSLQQAVRECVRNSIDARSSDIYVRIDCAQLSMLVNDDGEGIGEADLASLGERGCTSSPTTSDTLLRSRGQTLGAIAASSLLEIISKRRGHFQTWRKVFAGRQGSSISLAQRQQPYQGTSVWVPELLSYHPVRRRQLLMDRPTDALQATRHAITVLALPHTDISFSLQDVQSQQQLLHLRKGRSLASIWPAIFGSVEPRVGSISDANGISTTFAIHLPTLATSGECYHYIYINKHRVVCRQISELITAITQHANHIHRASVVQSTVLLLLECPVSMYTVVGWDQPGMSIEMSVLDPILAAVQSLVRQALDDEQAQPAPARKRPLAAVDPSSGSRPASKKSNSSPGAKSALHAVSQSRGWNADMQVREAAAASGTAGCSSLRLQPQRRRKALSQKGFVQRGAGPVRPHHSAPLPFTLARPPSKAPRSYQHPDHPWVPQRQARTHSMDDGPTLEHSSSQETGMPMASKQLVQNLPEPGLQGRLQRTEAGAAGPAASQPAGRTPLEELLSTWDNPCVAPISSIPRLQDLDSLSRRELVPAAVTRAELDTAVVLGQVDRKFLVAVCADILAVIDQHAADERVRLEHLQRELLSSSQQSAALSSVRLEQPLQLKLTSSELMACGSWAEQIRAWGWELVVNNLAGRADVARIPVVLGKHLTTNDLQEYLQQLSSSCGAASVPQAVHRLLASKACRSAVMFGDSLSMSKAQAIVDNLKATALCFECAHGRPTMAPLVHLSRLRRGQHGKALGSSTAGGSQVSLPTLKEKLLHELEQ